MKTLAVKTPPAKPSVRGLVCAQCGCAHFFTVYTRPKEGFILRRKECRHCGRRILTRESSGITPL